MSLVIVAALSLVIATTVNAQEGKGVELGEAAVATEPDTALVVDQHRIDYEDALSLARNRSIMALSYANMSRDSNSKPGKYAAYRNSFYSIASVFLIRSIYFTFFDKSKLDIIFPVR